MADSILPSFLRPSKKSSLLVLALYTFIFSFLMPDAGSLWSDYGQILSKQSYLMTDFTAMGMAATFFNVACHFVIAYILVYTNTRSRLNGLQVAAAGIFAGHALFGTHILNILPIFYGVYLYSRWTGQSFGSLTTVSLFATSAAPFISFWAIAPGLSWWSIILAVLIGTGVGFISAPLAEQYLKFHQGFNLYNFGFAMGLIAMFGTISFRYFKLEVPSLSILNQEHHGLLVLYLLGILLGLFGLAVFKRTEVKANYGKLLRRAGRTPDDFLAHFGFGTAAFNMALNGSLYLLLALALGVQLNGPILGGILGVMGFSAFGKHPRNCLPISAGILLAALLLGQDPAQSSVWVPILFGTTLAPIAGHYGIIYGAVAGFLHYNVVSMVFSLHAGMSLYNNGFAGGFVAAFLVPIYDTLRSNHHAYDD